MATMESLTCDVDSGTLRAIRMHAIEVIRGISAPVRDDSWATLLAEGTADTDPDGTLRSRTCLADGALDTVTTYRIDHDAARIEATFEAQARRGIVLNRAGFTLLHPLDGVRGSALTVTHPSERMTQTVFPATVMPGQPAFDIAGLDHVVHGMVVRIRMSGEVFEMEDQRNWTDASSKTYCRPLAAPRTFILAAGATIFQTLTVSWVAGSNMAWSPLSIIAIAPTRPRVALDTQADWWRAEDAGILRSCSAQALHIRAAQDENADWIGAAMTAARDAGMDVTLEHLVDRETAPPVSLAAMLAALGHHPDRVVALLRGYMQSRQPVGPWPDGPTPRDAVEAAKAAFPQAEIGAGTLAYSPEISRCPPDPTDGDFVTFGMTAITHAADDLSVRQTLESLPDVFATARDIAGKRPLRPGLCAIGMRTNPYGASTIPNPDDRNLAMAQDDPRQSSDFAARFARDVWEAAGRAGVVELALASPSGPFGVFRDGCRLPIAAAVADCARRAAA